LESGNLFGHIIEIVKKIPAGKLATYGMIAELAGINDARKVGWALHNCDASVPWHRVINKTGKLSLRIAEEQRFRLEKEGIEFINNKVNLEQYLWNP
jgi:methylated-DNA-protein-cysteine methyltransferase-like protein